MTDDITNLQRALALAEDEDRRLRVELAGVRQNLDQVKAAREAERAARQNAEARLYAYGNHQYPCPLWNDLRGVCTCGYSRVLETPSPFVAELEAARAVVALARDWRAAVETLNGVFRAEQALIGALVAYDAAVKASQT